MVTVSSVVSARSPGGDFTRDRTRQRARMEGSEFLTTRCTKGTHVELRLPEMAALASESGGVRGFKLE